MQVKELIAEFSVKETLPIDLKEVEDALRAKEVEDEIYYFYDQSLDHNILAGFILTEDIPWGDETKRFSTITYAKMGHEVERLVCCKEMLHILDPEYLQTRSIEAVDRLISEIILPPELSNMLKNGVQSNFDMIGITHAIAVLMPLAAIEIFRPIYKAGRITIEEIAKLAELPIFAINFAMSDVWPDLHAKLVYRFPRVVA